MPTAMSTNQDGRNPVYFGCSCSAADNSPLQRALHLISCSTPAQRAFVMQQHEAREQNSNVISFSISYYSWVRNQTESVRWGEDGAGRENTISCSTADVQVQMCSLGT